MCFLKRERLIVHNLPQLSTVSSNIKIDENKCGITLLENKISSSGRTVYRRESGFGLHTA